jgi:hypothetical protein
VAAGGSTGQVLQKLSATSYDTGWLTLPADYITSVAAPLDVTAGNLSVDLSPYAPINAPTFTGVVTIPSGADIGTGATIGATALIGTGATITSPTLSGVPITPTASTSDNSFQVASTAFVKNQGYLTTALAASTYQTLAGMSSYLTTSAAASTYAVIAAGQPVAGSTGQVLTKQSGTNYDSIWTTIVPGDRYLTTSTTSNTIGNGNKTFTIGTGLSYTPTQNITIAYDASNHMHGEVLTYNSGTGVLTVDVNNHTGSGTYTAWVVNVGGVTPATSVAWGDITGTLSTQTDLQSALDLKANLASPTFTGTPTLPTGTIATTQSPGNNTTALATTAFVTAAVPAFATETQAIVGTSSTTALSPALAPSFLTRAECRSLAYFKQTAISGSGGVTTSSIDYGAREMYLPTLAIGRAGWMYGITGANIPNMSRADWRKVDFSKKIWLSGRAMAYSTTGFGSSYPGDANTFARITLGGYSTNTTGDMTLLGIGWKKQGGLASFYTLTVHNGTTRTDVATSVSATDNSVIDWVLYSEGNGNVSFYINGTLAASTSAGPTGITASYAGMYREQVEAATTPTARQILETTGGWLYMEA